MIAVGTYKCSDSPYMSVLNREFNSVVAENEMKWDATEPQRGVFNYSGGDRIVSHARANGMSVRGHTYISLPWRTGLLTQTNSTC